MNIYIACELDNSEKKIIKNNLKKHNLYFSKLKFKKIADNNFLKCEIGFGNIPPDWIKQSSKIRWIQLESTGFAEYSNVKKNFLNKDVIITNLKSFFACQVAQTTLAGIFSFYRGLDIFTLFKKEKKWIGDPIRATLEILNNKLSEQVKPIWPSLLDFPIFIDKTLDETVNKNDEYIFWAN